MKSISSTTTNAYNSDKFFKFNNNYSIVYYHNKYRVIYGHFIEDNTKNMFYASFVFKNYKIDPSIYIFDISELYAPNDNNNYILFKSVKDAYTEANLLNDELTSNKQNQI